MEFIRDICGEYVNISHVSTIKIEPAYHNGKPLFGKYWVLTFIPFVGTNILFVGSEFECIEFIDYLINKKQ